MKDLPRVILPHSPSFLALLTRAAAVTLLAISLITSGLFVCRLPASTELLAQAFSGSSNSSSPFSHDELIEAALETANYTVGSHDYNSLIETLQDINQTAATPYANATSEELLQAPDTYTLDADSISHLDDVYAVIANASKILTVIALLAAVFMILVGKIQNAQKLGWTLVQSSVAVISFFSLCAFWALIDFYSFFNFLHSLFFSEGSWYFSSESLLITMYPSAFWMGMGAIWLTTTTLLSILSLAVGITVLRRNHNDC